jgi:hypothetical protein
MLVLVYSLFLIAHVALLCSPVTILRCQRLSLGKIMSQRELPQFDNFLTTCDSV